jgi:hypothetical protein
MQPPAEFVHWMFATGVLLVGLCLLAQAVVGDDVWRRRAWRAYLWPSLAFAMGVLMWPVMVFFTNSTMLMLAGGAELGLLRGKLHSPYWRLTMPLMFVVSGSAFLIHEQNSWFFARAAFLHHLIGWTLVVGAIFPLLLVFRPRSAVWRTGFALTFVVLSVMLYSDRDLAPVFGHLSPEAGAQHR